MKAGIEFRFFNVGGEVVEVRHLMGFGDGDVVEFPEVPTGALRAVRLGLEVQR